MVMVDDGADLDLASHLHCESAKYDEAFAAAREAIKTLFLFLVIATFHRHTSLIAINV